MSYRCEAKSVTGFVQQFGCCYVLHGYHRYVVGAIPERKDPRIVDGSNRGALRDRPVAVPACETQEGRPGERSVHSLPEVFRALRDRTSRCASISTRSTHLGRQANAALLRSGTSRTIRWRSVGTPSATTEASTEGGTSRSGSTLSATGTSRHTYSGVATKWSVANLESEFRGLRFEPYAPVRRQLLCLLRAVNRERKRKGWDAVPATALRLNRQIVRPFVEEEAARPLAEEPVP